MTHSFVLALNAKLVLHQPEPSQNRTVYHIAEDASRVFMALAAVACFVPARAAVRVDPLTSLRES